MKRRTAPRFLKARTQTLLVVRIARTFPSAVAGDGREAEGLGSSGVGHGFGVCESGRRRGDGGVDRGAVGGAVDEAVEEGLVGGDAGGEDAEEELDAGEDAAVYVVPW